jgi:hypothetical protein
MRAKTKNCKSYEREVSLHRAWAGLQFDRTALQTEGGLPLRIFNPGKLNHDQGPDFLDAVIGIGEERHYGHVELHIDAGDWYRHGHHLDQHYNPVMLHVFLLGGRSPTLRADGTQIPDLCLGDRIAVAPAPKLASTLPCSALAQANLPPYPHQWLESAGFSRLLGKAEAIRPRLEATCYNWSQVLWEEVAATLGGPVNGLQMRQLAQQAPWSLIQKRIPSATDMEAILFGSAGLLSGKSLDDYHMQLQATWEFLQQKHRLEVRQVLFKFHRMHPMGFPTVRMAQLARLATDFQPFSQLMEVEGMRRLLWSGVSRSDYWSCRHRFGMAPCKLRHELGQDMRQRLIVNVLAPMALLLGNIWGRDSFPSSNAVAEGLSDSLEGPVFPVRECQDPGKGNELLEGDGLFDLLRALPPEGNKITRQFSPLGLKPRNALEAQGLIGIHKTQCTNFRCLDCEIGKRAMGGG